MYAEDSNNTKDSDNLNVSPQPLVIDTKDVGQRIQQARKDLKLSQTELGNRINLSRVSISQIENGNRRHINPYIIQRVAQALERPETYFYDLQQIEQEKPAQSVSDIQNTSPLLKQVVKELFTLSMHQQNKAAHFIAELLAWREA